MARQKNSLAGRQHETEPKPCQMSDRRQIMKQSGQVHLSDFPVKLSEGTVEGHTAGREMSRR